MITYGVRRGYCWGERETDGTDRPDPSDRWRGGTGAERSNCCGAAR